MFALLSYLFNFFHFYSTLDLTDKFYTSIPIRLFTQDHETQREGETPLAGQNTLCSLFTVFFKTLRRDVRIHLLFVEFTRTRIRANTVILGCLYGTVFFALIQAKH